VKGNLPTENRQVGIEPHEMHPKKKTKRVVCGSKNAAPLAIRGRDDGAIEQRAMKDPGVDDKAGRVSEGTLHWGNLTINQGPQSRANSDRGVGSEYS